MSVTCVCTRASINFANPRPRKSIECCCCDCHLALEWCHEQGGIPAPNPPLTLLYFDNDISGVKGEDFLQVVRLRETGPSGRLVATCCYTILAVSHWAYLGNRVMVPPGARIEYEGETVKPELRIQTKWWDERRNGPLPPFSGKEVTSSMPWWAMTCGMLPHFACGLAAGNRQGESIQALMRRLGTPIVAGVPEPRLSHHTVVGVGMLTLTLSTWCTRFLAILVFAGAACFASCYATALPK